MKPQKPPKGPPFRFWVFAAGLCAVAFALGWFGQTLLTPPLAPAPVRLGGYQFINPLLSCNFSSLRVFPENQAIHTAIQTVVDDNVAAGNISKGSVYFGDFVDGKWASVYNDQKYYPSSLGKIPIMMAYYGLAEESSTVLDEKITYPTGGPDLNAVQDIQPPKAIVPGETYTVEDLIEYMIQYSDNNAAALLAEHIDPSSLTSVYNDLQIPTENDVTIQNADFITAQQVSTLFRVLYNGTYLSHDFSEKALQVMSGSSFTQGIVAGLPSPTVVSHKLGLVGITSGGVTTEHELHDCGIVYAPSHPYLLCIMTRGSSSLQTMEGVIASISQTVYQKVTNP